MNIPTTFKALAFIGLAGGFLSCNKDLGNYDYQEINEISVGGLNPSYSAMSMVDTLHIVPLIEMTEPGADPTRFDYVWVAKKGREVIDTVGRSRELNYPVALPPDNYTLHLRVLDTHTDLVWSGKTAFQVGNAFSRGILVIGEGEDGYAEVDMIAMVTDTSVRHNLLSQSGLPPLEGPIGIRHTGGTVSTSKLWVFTESGSYHLDRTTMKSDLNQHFGRQIYTTDTFDKNSLKPVLWAPQLISQSGTISSTTNRAMVTREGLLFTTSGGDLFANPVNRVAEDYRTLLHAAPYLIYPLGSMTSMMWYDDVNHRFMNLGAFSAKQSVALIDAAGDPFPWDQRTLGRKLVYAENSRNSDGGAVNGNSFTIMEDEQGNHYIYRFYANGANPLKTGYYPVSGSATGFDRADLYAFSSQRSVAFYVADNVLYAYDYNPGNEKIYRFDLFDGDEITMLKFDTEIDHTTNSLYIATYNPQTKGTLRRFVVGNDPNFVGITPAPRSTWSGLVKIKNIAWRAVN